MMNYYKGLFFTFVTAAAILLFADSAFAVKRGYNVYLKPGKRSSIFMNTRDTRFAYTGKRRGKYRQVRYTRNGKTRTAWVDRRALTRKEERSGGKTNSKINTFSDIDFQIPNNYTFNPDYNVRARPSVGSHKRGKAGAKKYKLTGQVAHNGRWLQVTCPGCSKPRWIHKDALRPTHSTPLIGDLNLDIIDPTLPHHNNTPNSHRGRVLGQKNVVNVNECVNMREAPSAGTEKLDCVPKGATVDILTYDKKGTRTPGWYHVGYGGKVGYIAKKYLASPKDYAKTQPGPVDTNVAKNRKEAYKKIAALASARKHSKCMNRRSNPNKLKRRHSISRTRYGTQRASLRSAIGYYQGSVIAFARAICRPSNDPVKKAMLRGRTGKVSGGRYRDMLRHYKPGAYTSRHHRRKTWRSHSATNAKLYGPVDGTEKNLISVMSIMLSKGMRESGGNYRDGRDRAASNYKPLTTEAGLYQSSYNVHSLMQKSAKKAALSIVKKYKNNRHACMKDVFDKKRPRTRGDKTSSTGRRGTAARDFQDLMRSCPAASVEHTLIAVRQGMHHYGPVKRKEALPYKECVPMLEEVYEYVKANPAICDSLAINPKPPRSNGNNTQSLATVK